MNMSSDPVLLQYLQQAEDDIAVTKYLVNMLLLESRPDPSHYLDTTVTKFLDSPEDGIAVTKYLSHSSTPSETPNAVSKYLNGPAADEIPTPVGKFLGQRSNDIVVTMFLDDETGGIDSVAKFLGDYDITIIEFLNQVLPETLQEDNDISVTKFLDRQIGHFLADNEISVTKFLESRESSYDNSNNEISITKFLSSSDPSDQDDQDSKSGHRHSHSHKRPKLTHEQREHKEMLRREHE